METSFNCLILDDETLNSKNNNEIFTKLGDDRYNIEKFKVDYLKDYICNVNKSDKRAVRLWKVNVVDEVAIKEKLKR
ncbi:hypothetical protein GLOIN_2v1148199 [Rhizophagus clarus]|uniref:Uncharacterized protein n=1 Tax=Rhizophagus clarus TaxID=94130 RepID=A0A8H3L1C2_9GLOM|nr:hypothetical protein GLOIN_2v1148199 [Rhizophagus clarus]